MKKGLCLLLLAALLYAPPALAMADVETIDLSKADSTWIIGERVIISSAEKDREITVRCLMHTKTTF